MARKNKNQDVNPDEEGPEFKKKLQARQDALDEKAEHRAGKTRPSKAAKEE